MNLTQKILIGMAAGIVVGVLLNVLAAPTDAVFTLLVGGVFHVVGAIFIAVLQMMVVPLVLVSLICGVASIGDPASLGRVGAKTMALYLATTALAVAFALAAGWLFAPGAGFQLAGAVTFTGAEPPPLTQVLIGMVPTNPIRAMADGEVLQIIVFALVFGLALTQVRERAKRVLEFFVALNEIILKMVFMVMRLAPLGVFALLATTFANQGFDVFRPLAGYFFVTAAVLIGHLLLTYQLMLRAVGLNPLMFLSKMRTAMSFAFSTASSNATIPVTMNTLETRLGVKNSIASFTVPLGATINMDGTAIMQGVATVFIANVYGVDLTLIDYLTVILTATLASIGAAGVPSAGLIMLALVLQQVGLPVEGIGLIIGIDRLLDMLRTAMNITGDAVVTCIVALGEGALSKDVYDDPTAILDPRLRSQ